MHEHTYKVQCHLSLGVEMLMSAARRHTSDNRRRQRHRILFRTPSWFFNKAWEISSLQAYSGWTFTLRSLNVIPFDSPIFRYSENGDLQALRDLFSQNVASPFDCNEYGRTALQVRFETLVTNTI